MGDSQLERDPVVLQLGRYISGQRNLEREGIGWPMARRGVVHTRWADCRNHPGYAGSDLQHGPGAPQVSPAGSQSIDDLPFTLELDSATSPGLVSAHGAGRGRRPTSASDGGRPRPPGPRCSVLAWCKPLSAA